jgi:hypothetical protein
MLLIYDGDTDGVVDSSESLRKIITCINMAVRMSMTNDDYDAYCATLLLLRWIRCWVAGLIRREFHRRHDNSGRSI